MYNLQDIQITVQQTAEAIAAALKIEVEIADADLIRVAGTGKYRSRCGCPMNDGYVYRYVMATGHPVIIDNPGFNELCRPCGCRGNCLEHAEVALPIRVGDEIIGVVGLISFDEEQAKRLMDNQESLQLFLNKMAELLVSKVIENRQNRERELLTDQLLIVLNQLNDGILLVNSQKQVTNYNGLGAKMLDINDGPEINLPQLLDDKKLWQAVERGEEFSGQVMCRRMATQLFCDAIPFKKDGAFEGALVTLKDLQRIKKLVKVAALSDVETHFSQIIGNCVKLQELKDMALRVAPSNSTLLILGESGTGKELLARAIHQSSKRKNHAFIALNCGAIPENLLESELFGYEEGAFTGARRGGKLGKFELAHHGTIFLDEIGDMPLHLQVKLLRVLQERRIERIGSSRSIPVDVRIIAATHCDLETMVKNGEFREDLYYRLNVIPLTIPPLREREGDITLLSRFYLDYYCEVTGKEIKGITADAVTILEQYPWPGNVRELGNVIEYSVNMTTGEYIGPEVLPKRIKNQAQAQAVKHTLVLNLKEIERETIAKALAIAAVDGHKDDAAKLLGISRATLYRKIKEYQITENKLYT